MPKWSDGLTDEELEARRERARQWNRDNRERHDAGVKRFRQRHPEKVAAKNAVHNAIKRGKLQRQPCEVCGNPDVQAHHDDYTQKLAVRWLCVRHHAEADVQRRAVDRNNA